MLHLPLTSFPPIHTFARGGGGGSGGGGGGGGGIIALIGYLPTHALGSFSRRKLPESAGLFLTILGTLLYAAAWMFAGTFGALIAIAALFGGPSGYFDWFGKVSLKVRKKAKQDIAAAASADSAWDTNQLSDRITEVFMQFQADWSSFKTDNFSDYMTPGFAYYNKLMMLAIQQRQRRNDVQSPEIIELYPVEVNDEADNSEDHVVYMVHAKAHDVLYESVDGQETELFADDNEFYEFWRFARHGSNWRLDNITQSTENKVARYPEIEAFAEANNMYYSLDWGWLLLPNHGQLFSGGTFGKSDINNHVIGVYKDLLVELYSYSSKIGDDASGADQYVIAQVALPKRYDSIIVEAKGMERNFFPLSFFDRAPKGYNKLSLEWPDFNKRYNVYATNVEQVTAFELLHPVYMEKLFALPFKVSIEVANNVVYLYTDELTADYGVMFDLLKDAFKEMRL